MLDSYLLTVIYLVPHALLALFAQFGILELRICEFEVTHCLDLMTYFCLGFKIRGSKPSSYSKL